MREGVLKIVPPNEGLNLAYLMKSREYMDAAKMLAENGKYDVTVSIAYYSMYYTALSLLFKTGIKCENHTAVIILLDTIYGLDADPLSKAKGERVDTQYYVSTKVTENDAKLLIGIAEEFIA